MIIGFGLLTLLNASSSTGAWMVYQSMIAAGSSTILSSILPAIQTSLSDEDPAASTALFAFIRSFGAIWGIAIPVAVFNNQFHRLLYLIQGPAEGPPWRMDKHMIMLRAYLLTHFGNLRS
ncbi:uncharacterized protein LY89DRAFT_733752 [Mollisia scopiformis]|uniref:Uncharacterized protein n=1 Tax=Mollisia scopiformis TaxID=149040 RepID=A0A194X998_MOLSC|nr:uncharacterized protein LY89DRAFT_733752 [Mollisia scopiformis]KUJ16745.1 hypothetical protein LY89DRAFT_733752 [Mollisia scopiformis]